MLSRPMELLFEEDIRNVVNTCIILHNMMVELRVQREQQGDMAWYDQREYDNEDLEEVPLLSIEHSSCCSNSPNSVTEDCSHELAVVGRDAQCREAHCNQSCHCRAFRYPTG
jgi:hypothetical protein